MYDWQKDDQFPKCIDWPLRKEPSKKAHLPVPLDCPKALEAQSRRDAISYVAQNETNLVADWLVTRKEGERNMRVDFEAESRSRNLLGKGERMRVSLQVEIW